VKKIILVLAALPLHLTAQPDRFSLPACSAEGLELADRAFFLLCHSSILKVPMWAGYEIKRGQLGGAVERPKQFGADAGLAGDKARNADYRGSGYSRGHLVPAEDFAWSGAGIRATFLLSNVVPQRQSVNAGAWRQLEGAVRRLAACSDAVYVFSGPVFAGDAIERIGAGQVAVPTHTFKVVLAVADGRKTMYAAVAPNASTRGLPLSAFLTTVEEVERRTGLDFFSGLDDSEEHALESRREAFQCHERPATPVLLD
jgi:endonuclease G, mitochondrial